MRVRLFGIISFALLVLLSSCIVMKEGLIIKGQLSSPKLVEGFEGMEVGDSVAPGGTELLYIKGTRALSGGWSVSQGDHAATLWEVSVAAEGYGDSKQSLKYKWDNRNAVWLDSSMWFWEVETWQGAEEFRFMIKSSNTYKFDISIQVQDRKGKQVAFTTSTPRVGGGNEWQEVKVLLSKFSVPGWYISEQGEPPIKKIPRTPVVAAISISPVWNSHGECLIDQIQFGKKTIEAVPLKMKEKKNWEDSGSFVCFYGPGSVEEMSQFDVAIIEGRSQNKENIATLKSTGTWVVSYVTVGEDDTLRKGDGKGPGGYASYYLDVDHDNVPDKNQNWDSYYVNANSPVWREWIINNRVRQIVEDFGCDGIFMDTVDTVDVYKDTADGMVDLIRSIRETYPDIKIVQNRGFAVLKKTAPYIDGLMYEDFSIHYDWDNDTYHQASRSKLLSTGIFAVRINEIRKEKDFLVFDLGYADSSDTELIQFCYDRGWEYDFIPYVASLMLDEVYPLYTPQSERGVKKFTGEGGTAEVIGDPERIKKMNKYKELESRHPGNLASYHAGTLIKADSSFADYDPIHLIDGFTNNPAIEWDKAAWASLELPIEHWVQIELSAPQKIKRVEIYWALDNGVYYDSREIKFQYLFQGYWKDLGVLHTSGTGENHKDVLMIENPEIGRTFRLFQPEGMGAKERSHLMWIAEIELFTE